MVKDPNRLSRMVSHALRHEPWLYALELDDEGWVDVGPLLKALRERSHAWPELTELDLSEMISKSSNARYEMLGGRLRALYGHSVPGRVRRAPAAPPVCLFHGTAPAAVAKIRERGLLPMGRQYVHLSLDRDTAVAVGRRKSPDPVILQIRAADAYGAGVVFYLGNEKVWLADRVPPQFIDPESVPSGQVAIDWIPRPS